MPIAFPKGIAHGARGDPSAGKSSSWGLCQPGARHSRDSITSHRPEAPKTRLKFNVSGGTRRAGGAASPGPESTPGFVCRVWKSREIRCELLVHARQEGKGARLGRGTHPALPGNTPDKAKGSILSPRSTTGRTPKKNQGNCTSRTQSWAPMRSHRGWNCEGTKQDGHSQR